MQVGHFTWNVLHFQCMFRRSDIPRSGMGPIQIGNFCPCNLCEKKQKIQYENERCFGRSRKKSVQATAKAAAVHLLLKFQKAIGGQS